MCINVENNMISSSFKIGSLRKLINSLLLKSMHRKKRTKE